MPIYSINGEIISRNNIRKKRAKKGRSKLTESQARYLTDERVFRKINQMFRED